MKMYLPSDNPLTGDYTATHKAYDHAGLNLPDQIRAGAIGVVIERVDAYSSNWTNTGILTTKDYGNYLKIKHDDGTFELHAHLKQGSALAIGTRVITGQIIARIGNTGNSSGPHVHSEYRNAQNINEAVEFYTGGGETMTNYKGYDLDNKDSMKVAVDILVRVQAGEFIDKSKYDALEKEAIELRKRPSSCPPTVDVKAEKLKIALKEFLE